MCGIVAYVGRGRCKDYVLEGLSRLEYRGYDSTGYVCLDEKRKHLTFVKKVGSVSTLKEAVDLLDYDGSIGMGHSRWATHGVVNEINTHPHFNCNKTLAVIHNGIVEGYTQLRARLERGARFLFFNRYGSGCASFCFPFKISQKSQKCCSGSCKTD